jgi:hypothetical protein
MPLKNRKSAYLIAISAALTLVLTGCSNGSNAPTRMIRQVTDGVEGASGSINARDMLIVAQPDGSGVLVGTIINEGTSADAVTAIKVNSIAVTFGNKNLALAQNTPLIFAGDSATNSGVIAGLNATPGTLVPLDIDFANSAPIQLSALVREKADIYANVGPAAPATAATPAKK